MLRENSNPYTQKDVDEKVEEIKRLTKELNDISTEVACCPRCEKDMGYPTDYRNFSGGRSSAWGCSCDNYSTRWLRHEIQFKRILK